MTQGVITKMDYLRAFLGAVSGSKIEEREEWTNTPKGL